MAAAAGDHPRLLIHNFISPQLCKELEFIHRSCGTAGYRAGVISTTLSHLVATGCGHLLLPFIPIRELIKEMAESTFGCEFELFVEFTGLISWCKGASIGWHSDDNRPYLSQRHFAAVCYLNSHGEDFQGGAFHFKDGEPASVVPVAGDILIYTADSRNIHSVDEVICGERLTLTLWFTRDCSHDEDAKLIHLLSQRLNCGDSAPQSYIPLPASDNMYWFPYDHLGFDIRCGRCYMLGYHFCSDDAEKLDTCKPLCDSSVLLSRPVRVCRGDMIYKEEFLNSLHALQVVQFYNWKASELKASSEEMSLNSTATPTLVEALGASKYLIQCNHRLTDTVFRPLSHGVAEVSFSWDEFRTVVQWWECYMNSLHKQLLTLMPYWVAHQTLFIPDSEPM